MATSPNLHPFDTFTVYQRVKIVPIMRDGEVEFMHIYPAPQKSHHRFQLLVQCLDLGSQSLRNNGECLTLREQHLKCRVCNLCDRSIARSGLLCGNIACCAYSPDPKGQETWAEGR